jgi:hypothetical protein
MVMAFPSIFISHGGGVLVGMDIGAISMNGNMASTSEPSSCGFGNKKGYVFLE